MVIAYYMKVNRESFKSAIKFVKNIRPTICPNLGFELQLKKYETELGIGTNNNKAQKEARDSNDKNFQLEKKYKSSMTVSEEKQK